MRAKNSGVRRSGQGEQTQGSPFDANRALVFSIAFVFAVLSGCGESTSPFEYRREAVVNATLVANQRLVGLSLTWTGTVDGYYSASALGIANALVVIRDADGSYADTLFSSGSGSYSSFELFRTILPRHTYDLYIRTPEPDVRIITGRTSVPDTFSIISSTLHDGDSVRYDLDAPVNSFEWSPSRNFAAYLPTVESTDQSPELIPKAYYGDTDSPDFHRPSHLVYRIGLPKTQTNTDVPWVFLNYYGKTRFDIFAVDENCSDFLNQWLALQTGELKEIRYKLQGGIGLFCSKSRAKNGVLVTIVK